MHLDAKMRTNQNLSSYVSRVWTRCAVSRSTEGEFVNGGKKWRANGWDVCYWCCCRRKASIIFWMWASVVQRQTSSTIRTLWEFQSTTLIPTNWSAISLRHSSFWVRIFSCYWGLCCSRTKIISENDPPIGRWWIWYVRLWTITILSRQSSGLGGWCSLLVPS